MWYCFHLSGEVRDLHALRSITELADFHCAVDGGLDRALALGVDPQLWVGDKDSISSKGIEWMDQHPERLTKLPEKKDLTDSEYAITKVLDEWKKVNEVATYPLLLGAPSGMILSSALGSRHDHVLANLALARRFASPEFPVLITDGQSLIWTLKAPFHCEITWPEMIENNHSKIDRKRYFSLLSASDEVHGIFLEGALWNLENASLKMGYNLGISNEVAEGKIPRLSFSQGELHLILSRESKEESRQWTLLK